MFYLNDTDVIINNRTQNAHKYAPNRSVNLKAIYLNRLLRYEAMAKTDNSIVFR